MSENENTIPSSDTGNPSSSGDYHAKQWNTVTGPPVVSDWEDGELLRRRAFWVKVLAVAFFVMAICSDLFLYHIYVRDTLPLIGEIWIFDMVCYSFVFLISFIFPCVILFYFLNSISIALKSSAELHGKIGEMQKKLVALEKSIAKSSPQETLEQ